MFTCLLNVIWLRSWIGCSSYFYLFINYKYMKFSVCKTSSYITLLLTSMPFLSSIGPHLLRWITICKLNLNEVRLKNYLKFLTNQSIRYIYIYTHIDFTHACVTINSLEFMDTYLNIFWFWNISWFLSTNILVF